MKIPKKLNSVASILWFCLYLGVKSGNDLYRKKSMVIPMDSVENVQIVLNVSFYSLLGNALQTVFRATIYRLEKSLGCERFIALSA